MKSIRNAILNVGEFYKNRYGGLFHCLEQTNSNSYLLQNVVSGCTCECHNITLYEDDTIEWAYSRIILPKEDLNRRG